MSYCENPMQRAQLTHCYAPAVMTNGSIEWSHSSFTPPETSLLTMIRPARMQTWAGTDSSCAKSSCWGNSSYRFWGATEKLTSLFVCQWSCSSGWMPQAWLIVSVICFSCLARCSEGQAWLGSFCSLAWHLWSTFFSLNAHRNRADWTNHWKPLYRSCCWLHEIHHRSVHTHCSSYLQSTPRLLDFFRAARPNCAS